MKCVSPKSKIGNYRKFFRKMKKNGMFKAVIYDGRNFNEYNYPGMRMDPWKAELIVFVMLMITLFIVVKTRNIIRYDFFIDNGKIKIEDRIDEFGMTNLHRAVINGKSKTVLKLIEYGADLNSGDNYGWTPLHWAEFLRRDKICKILVDHGAIKEMGSEKEWFIYKKGITPEELNEL